MPKLSSYPPLASSSLLPSGENLLPFVTVGPAGTFSDYLGNGTTDDIAINAALSSLNNNGKLIQRPGIYTITSNVNIGSNINYQGAGYATLMNLSSGIKISCDTQSHVKVSDLRIDGINVGTNNIAFLINNPTDITVDGIWLLNTSGFGVFLNATNNTTNSKVRIVNNYFSGTGVNDILGGGPGNAMSFIAELIITDNFIVQNVNGTGTYYNAIDIVAQQKTVIANNVTQGNIILGGEKIPHYEVNVISNVVGQAPGGSIARIAVLTSSNAGQSADSSCINIIGNQINGGSGGGQIFVQGQSSTNNRTRKVIIKGNNIVSGNTNTETCWGLDLQYLADVTVEGNTIDGAFRGIYLSNVAGIDISNNRFINCTTPIVFGAASTNVTGHNNIGINPDVTYAQGNISGATTFDRVNGNIIMATLTGNITVTLNNGVFLNDILTLELTQDGTGSRTVTWPSNFKKAGGSLVLTATAGAIDNITMSWNGTNWVEISRSLNVN